MKNKFTILIHDSLLKAAHADQSKAAGSTTSATQPSSSKVINHNCDSQVILLIVFMKRVNINPGCQNRNQRYIDSDSSVWEDISSDVNVNLFTLFFASGPSHSPCDLGRVCGQTRQLKGYHLLLPDSGLPEPFGNLMKITTGSPQKL